MEPDLNLDAAFILSVMSRTIRVLFGAALAASAIAGPSSAARAAALPCDRACLRTVLDSYLTAVSKHDPAAAPLMIGFRQTENAIVVRPGNGLWKSMTGLGSMQRRYFYCADGELMLVPQNSTPMAADRGSA